MAYLARSRRLYLGKITQRFSKIELRLPTSTLSECRYDRQSRPDIGPSPIGYAPSHGVALPHKCMQRGDANFLGALNLASAVVTDTPCSFLQFVAHNLKLATNIDHM